MAAMVMETNVPGESDSRQSERIVVLGASNVIIGLRPIVEAVMDVRPQTSEFFVAAGHGRSYGMRSRVIGRVLPGITQCGLWDALESSESGINTRLLVTDVGNDLIYGVGEDQILKWVRECLQRSPILPGGLIITGLPMSSVQSLGRFRFLFARSVLFPTSKLLYEGLVERCCRLNEGLLDLASDFEGEFVTPQADWYGFDPIHIRRSQRADAWRTVTDSWRDADTSKHRLALSKLNRVYRVRHEERTMFGVVQRRAQPSHVLSNGTTIGLY